MIPQEQLPLVAMPSMNDTHLEELILINHLSDALAARDAQQVSELLGALVAHTVEHFGGEEVMMREKAFPPYPMHKGEHDRALAEMRAQLASWQNRKDFDSLAYYVNVTLAQWIMVHIQTMDTVTANFLISGVSPCSSRHC
jgi:hemerythrin